MKLENQTLGGLECVVIDGESDKPVDGVVVLAHGLGANANDLAPLAAEFARIVPGLGEGIRYIFPEAPTIMGYTLMGVGRTWWQVDMEALDRAIQTGEPRMQRGHKPEEMDECRDLMTSLVDEVCKDLSIERSQIVLGGFSMGSMLALHTAMNLSEQVGGLLLFSSTLINEAEWREGAKKLAGMHIFQSHGRVDPLLRFEEAKALFDLLGEGGANVEFVEFQGEHTIGEFALHEAARYLASIFGRNQDGQ